MPIPLIGGLLAKEAVKNFPWRKAAMIGGAVLVVGGIVFMAWRGVEAYGDAVEAQRQAVAEARKAGVREGESRILAQWHAANTVAVQKNLDGVLANQRRQVEADRIHNERLAASLARMRATEGKIDVWRGTPKAAVECLDADFVRLLEGRRDSGNDPGGAAAPAAGR
jgi:CRP-like cAMP-binding protein